MDSCGSLKAGAFACAVACFSRIVKCDNIPEGVRSCRMRLRHREQGRAVVLTSRHMKSKEWMLNRAGGVGGDGAGLAADH